MKAALLVIALLFAVGCGSCMGCSANELAREEGAGWEADLMCSTSTEIGALGAAHVGGILFPDGCRQKFVAYAKNSAGSVSVPMKSSGGKGDCNKLKEDCKNAKGEVHHRNDGDDVVVVVTHDGESKAIYLPKEAPPFAYSGELDAAPDKALKQVPPADDAVEQMIDGGIPMTDGAWNLVHARMPRHKKTLMAELAKGTLEEDTALKAIDAFGDDAALAAYDAHFRGEPKQWGGLAALQKRSPKVIGPRVLEDLRRCNLSCPPTKFAPLAELAWKLKLTDAVPLLEPWLVVPNEDGRRPGSTSEAVFNNNDGFGAWHTAMFVHLQLTPKKLCPRLLQIFEASEGGYVHNQLTPDDAPHPGIGSAGSVAPDAASLLLECDDDKTRAAMKKLAEDKKRDVTLRQLAQMWLVAVKDPTGRSYAAGEKGDLDAYALPWARSQYGLPEPDAGH